MRRGPNAKKLLAAAERSIANAADPWKRIGTVTAAPHSELRLERAGPGEWALLAWAPGLVVLPSPGLAQKKRGGK